MLKTLDIVIPIYNENGCIDELLKRLLNLREDLSKENLDTRFIFVNDGSTDNSLQMLEGYAEKYKCVKIINFSRNFGHEIAVIAGLDNSTGDYTAIIDADLQDPPELIKDMYKKIQEGYQVAYGKRLKRKDENAFKKVTAYLFYRLLNKLCDIKLPTDTGNFRLITADVRNAITKVREHKRFIRGIAVWVGFKSVPVYYDREGRFAGETHYSLSAMLKLALAAIFEMSTAPITLIWWLASILFIAFLAFLIAGQHIISAIMFVGFIQVIATAIVGLYSGRIYEETRNRPLYIIDKITNNN